MKKVVLAVAGFIAVGALLYFFCFSGPKPMDEETFRAGVISAIRQRMEADYAPDLLFDDFPASAWIFAQRYGYKTYPDVRLGYDVVLEMAEGSKKGNFKVRVQNDVYELPFPDRVMSRVRYSFYSACPLEVVLYYDGRDKDIVEWVKIFKDIPVAGGSADGRELYGAGNNVRIVYRLKENKTKEIEITFYSEYRKKLDETNVEILEKSLKKTKAGDWVLRSQWCVPNSWIERRVDFEEFSRLQLKDFSYSLSVPILKGEIVLWNGYFVEGALYFTYDGWKKASVISKWFDIPEVDFTETRDGDIVEVRISDKLLKEIYLYLQRLMNSNSYDMIRKTILERSMK